MKEWIKIRKIPTQWAFVLILSLLSFVAHNSITVTGQSFSSAVGAKSLVAAKRKRNNNTNRKRELYKRLASEATFVKQVNKKKGDNNFFEKNNNKRDVPEFMFVNTGSNSNTKSRQLEEDGDDTTTSTLDDDYAFAQEFGYDYNVLKYSLKYVKCQAIQTFSDNMAEDENESNVLITKRFIVFRLCNSNDCDSSSDDIFGCEYDYGEYILEMELYLQIMQQYLEERKEAYCDFCEECMEEEDGRKRERRLEEEEAQQDDTDAQQDEDDASDAQEEDGDDGGEEDDGTEAAEEDDDDEESDVGDDTTESVTSGNNGDDDTNTATTSSQQEVQNGCAYYDECYDYENKCEDNQDDDGYIDYSEYFECQQYNNNNNNGGNNGDAEMYIGAHCGYDGQSIVIGLYYDQYCSEFAGYDIDIAEYTGIQFQEDGLQDYYSSDCISCKESELPYEQVEGDQEDDDDVSEICEDIYFNSGRCHSYLENDAGYNFNYQSQGVCNYIANVMSGQYDEFGQIFLNNEDYANQDIDSSFIASVYKVSPGQALILVNLVLLVIFLVAQAMKAHHELVHHEFYSEQYVYDDSRRNDTSDTSSGSRQNRSGPTFANVNALIHSHPSLDEGNFVAADSFDSAPKIV